MTDRVLAPDKYPPYARAIEILRVPQRQIITTIEFLSAKSKNPAHDAFEVYRAMRRKLINSGKKVVEIDLLRHGIRAKSEDAVPPAPYYITIHRRVLPSRLVVLPIQLQDHLPIVPIPLAVPDTETNLDLAPLPNYIYDSGRYAMQINYRNPPPSPKLSPQETEYVDSLLKPLRAHV